jgi:4-aminobutyrate aminotransferase
VRGLGLMVGVEFRDTHGKPDKPAAKNVIHACLDRKLLLLSCGPWDNTIRFIPPLIVSPAQIQEGLQVFAAALGEVRG